jgi:RES domain-containing protein
MIVYRISSNEYAGKLQASGIAARWNSAKQDVLYTSESRALACLENLVHRSSSQLSGLFRTQVIEIPDLVKITIMEEKNLPHGWFTSEKSTVCRELGSSWFVSAVSTVLKVPSALIPKEYNYVIHTHHPDYQQIKLLTIEEFYFDPRIIT